MITNKQKDFFELYKDIISNMEKFKIEINKTTNKIIYYKSYIIAAIGFELFESYYVIHKSQTHVNDALMKISYGSSGINQTIITIDDFVSPRIYTSYANKGYLNKSFSISQQHSKIDYEPNMEIDDFFNKSLEFDYNISYELYLELQKIQRIDTTLIYTKIHADINKRF